MKWSLTLDAEIRHRPNKRRIEQIQKERHEIAQLKRQLADLFYWYREHHSTDLSDGSPYLLAPSDEQRLTELIDDGRDLGLPALAKWYARINYWIAGESTVARNLQSLAPLLQPAEQLWVTQ
ncbi:MAG: hypothetical protein N2C12_18995 [Planctomycetales bacterium]